MHYINKKPHNSDCSPQSKFLPPASDEFSRTLHQLRVEEESGSNQSVLPGIAPTLASVDTLPVGDRAMGKIESRSLYAEEDYRKPSMGIGNGHSGHGSVKNSFSGGIPHGNGKSQPISYNNKPKNGHTDHSPGSKEKEKPKVKKLITSRSPRLSDNHGYPGYSPGHQVFMHAQMKDPSVYSEDFRIRSMSESHAQLRRKALERQERRNARNEETGGSGDIPHHVHWADTLGDSLTSDLRRRSFSHGAAGLPNKPILKKITNGVSSSDSKSGCENTKLLAVDTRYI